MTCMRCLWEESIEEDMVCLRGRDGDFAALFVVVHYPEETFVRFQRDHGEISGCNSSDRGVELYLGVSENRVVRYGK
jgi:hypothetical protein